jgi:uncharacterized membrane protein (UPF0127 family)
MKLLFETFIFLLISATLFVLYQNYWDDVRAALFSNTDEYTIYLGSVALAVSVADDEAERMQGLSGVPGLRDLEGKLFIFDTDAKQGIWMKDMQFPLDIIWIDRSLHIVHIEENVTPETYPNIFYPSSDARFVLEMNARFVSSLRIKVGDMLTLPPSLIPADIKADLQK